MRGFMFVPKGFAAVATMDDWHSEAQEADPGNRNGR